MFRTVTTAAILVLSLALPAAAQSSLVVHYGDLDLSRPADTQVLNSRIEKAAETACISLRSQRHPLFYKQWFDHCVSNATARASARIAALTSDKYHFVASK